MIVCGVVNMMVKVNVYNLETYSVENDRVGTVKITDPDQFFLDWVDAWNDGDGELLGATVYSNELNEDEF